jgi:radical SAM superfamily enzyme YgiQ (UPF0313 family)
MNNKKIALIRPYYEARLILPPLGLGYLAAYLNKHEYNAYIVDALKKRISNADILDFLRKNRITIVGITCLSDFYFKVISLSRFLKEHGITVIIGGVHPTFLPYQTLVETGADYVICGEGEGALKELLDSLCPPPRKNRSSTGSILIERA